MFLQNLINKNVAVFGAFIFTVAVSGCGRSVGSSSEESKVNPAGPIALSAEPCSGDNTKVCEFKYNLGLNPNYTWKVPPTAVGSYYIKYCSSPNPSTCQIRFGITCSVGSLECAVTDFFDQVTHEANMTPGTGGLYRMISFQAVGSENLPFDFENGSLYKIQAPNGPEVIGSIGE